MSVVAELTALTITAAWIGLIHTLVGPDHYLPFVAMSKARDWSTARTFWVTLLCGVGHVGSSIVLGSIGIALGMVLTDLTGTESLRGEIAGWLLLSFGLLYMVWGVRRAILNRPHTHTHLHGAEGEHAHEHAHTHEHAHVHDARDRRRLTPWVLFTIFIFGPCEPLIPLLMYPAASQTAWAVAIVASVFALTTIGTMLAVVMLAVGGLRFVRLRGLERYSHALAGATVFLCGLAIQMGL